MAQNTKKQGTPAKPANKPANNKTAAPADDLDDLDVDVDEDEEGDGDDASESSEANGKGASWKETMKLPPAKRVAVRLSNLVDRTQHQLDAMKSWTGEEQERARGIVEQVQQGLKDAAEVLAKIPDDWRPVRRAGGGGGTSTKNVELAPGTVIRITDKRVPEYDGVLEADQMKGIKVVEVRGNKVVAITPDGTRAMFARGHVCLDTTAAA